MSETHPRWPWTPPTPQRLCLGTAVPHSSLCHPGESKGPASCSAFCWQKRAWALGKVKVLYSLSHCGQSTEPNPSRAGGLQPLPEFKFYIHLWGLLPASPQEASLAAGTKATAWEEANKGPFDDGRGNVKMGQEHPVKLLLLAAPSLAPVQCPAIHCSSTAAQPQPWPPCSRTPGPRVLPS